MDFHLTGYGQAFYGRQLPMLIKQLVKIGKELERANDLKEREAPKCDSCYLKTALIKHEK